MSQLAGTAFGTPTIPVTQNLGGFSPYASQGFGTPAFPQQPYAQPFATPFNAGGYGASPFGIGHVPLSPVQQIAHGDEGRHPVDPFLTADVDGQLGGLVKFLRQGHPVQVTGLHAGPLQRHQPAAGQLGCVMDQCLDAFPGVDRDGHRRQVFGQGQ